MKTTHDGRPVLPFGSPLPEGASGFTLCSVQKCAYTTWLSPRDCERARADLARIEAAVSTLRSKRVAFEACERAGIWAGTKDTLRSLQVSLINHRVALAWPLIEAKPGE